jgi:hypothetical protein
MLVVDKVGTAAGCRGVKVSAKNDELFVEILTILVRKFEFWVRVNLFVILAGEWSVKKRAGCISPDHMIYPDQKFAEANFWSG